MLFAFKDRFPNLNPYWEKYTALQQRREYPARTTLLREGKVAQNYYFVEKGCLRLCFDNNGKDTTVQFFFENEGVASNVIIDYLWGHTAEMILASLRGTGSFTPATRFVSVGSVSGDVIQLSAANLRSVDLQLSGSGLGSWTKDQVRALFAEILPEMFQLAADGKLQVGTIDVAMQDIGTLWDLEVPDGKRLVVQI